MKAEATKRVIAMAMRVASDDDGNGNSGKRDDDGNEGAGRATTRAMAVVATVAGNDERNCDGNEGGKGQRG